MSDAVASMLFILLLIAFGLHDGCDLKGPGLAYQIDGQTHHLKLGDRK